MGFFSIFHALLVLIVLSIVGIPIGRILSRAGFSGWLALLWLVPIVNIVALWLFAFSAWPSERARREGVF